MFSSAQLQSKVRVTLDQLEGVADVAFVLRQHIEQDIGGTCIKAGYVQSHTVDVVSHSSGMCEQGIVVFDAVYRCQVAFPLVGDIVEARVESITKLGGLHCKSWLNDKEYVLELFVIRERALNDDDDEEDEFGHIKETQLVSLQLKDVRFEYGDKTITAIAALKSDSSMSSSMSSSSSMPMSSSLPMPMPSSSSLQNKVTPVLSLLPHDSQRTMEHDDESDDGEL
jgi:DNA-directed RNA polymerase subunit E'/Rpb7